MLRKSGSQCCIALSCYTDGKGATKGCFRAIIVLQHKSWVSIEIDVALIPGREHKPGQLDFDGRYWLVAP